MDFSNYDEKFKPTASKTKPIDEEPAYVRIRRSLKPTPPKVESSEVHDINWPNLRPTRPASGGEWAVTKIQAIWRGYSYRTNILGFKVKKNRLSTRTKITPATKLNSDSYQVFLFGL